MHSLLESSQTHEIQRGAGPIPANNLSTSASADWVSPPWHRLGEAFLAAAALRLVIGRTGRGAHGLGALWLWQGSQVAAFAVKRGQALPAELSSDQQQAGGRPKFAPWHPSPGPANQAALRTALKVSKPRRPLAQGHTAKKKSAVSCCAAYWRAWWAGHTPAATFDAQELLGRLLASMQILIM